VLLFSWDKLLIWEDKDIEKVLITPNMANNTGLAELLASFD